MPPSHCSGKVPAREGCSRDGLCCACGQECPSLLRPASPPAPRQLLVTPARFTHWPWPGTRAVLKHGWDLVVAHWLRLQAQVQGPRVQSLVRELEATCYSKNGRSPVHSQDPVQLSK